jgi:N-acetylglucosaminyldiphosphoundecaprenol N-acetyl-beta-D-mannosaminyltransferase
MASNLYPLLAPSFARHTVPVFGVPIDAVTFKGAVQRLAAWAASGESRSVCICNAHSAVTATEQADFMRALQQADMATPDGAPVAWLMRRLGQSDQSRVSGPDLMWAYMQHAAQASEPVYLYGSTPQTLALLTQRLLAQLPTLRIAGALSPPFRPLTEQEDNDIVQTINASGAKTVWVGLGCPKQELWMAEHKGRVQAVMVGVGAAFDFHAGTVSRAPLWVQNLGLEWLHRLCSEPGRLWKRYLIGNSQFLWLAAQQLAGMGKPR